MPFMSLRPMIRVVTFVTDVNDPPTDNFSMVMDLSYCSGRGSNPGTSNYHLRSDSSPLTPGTFDDVNPDARILTP